ncbi:universal stress protein [Mycolicibacterium moriokaense]|nr:universal stress protein [Mycolicibacterium moriokaense]
MADTNSTSPVIVGIDGSDTAIHAAKWAVEEAVKRGVPLRLVYVAKATHLGSEAYYEDIHHGRAVLEAAQVAIQSSGKPVEVESTILEGLPGTTLVAASRDAALICVGSVGIGGYAQAILGSTATELAEGAHCPVAVIRPQSGTALRDINWIVAAAKPGNDAVVEQAMEEAALRHAPVLLLGERETAQGWHRRYPDVHVYPIGDSADVADFLKKHAERVQLAVIAGADAGELAEIIGPTGHPVLHHADSSALVVRG